MAHIVIIDDDPRVLEVLVGMVRGLGHDVVGADSGPVGLTLIDQAPRDLLIVDLRMSGISGSEVLDQVRMRHPGVAVVVLTGYLDPESEAEMRRRGAAGFLSKPVMTGDLGRQIEAALSGRA